jgi:hypothetical protein
MALSADVEHALKNYLAILLGFTELLLDETAPGDPRRADFEEMHRAALEAVKLVSPAEEREP